MTASRRFEDRLLDELRQVVAARPAPAPAEHHRTRTTRLALAGVGVAAATAAVAVLATSDDATHSAYAVQARPDGAVTVSIHSLQDAAGLQDRLRAAGIPAVVDYVPSGTGNCKISGPPPTSTSTGGSEGGVVLHGGTAGDGPSFSRHGTASADGAGSRATMSMVGTDGGDATFTIDPGALKPGEKVYITTSTGAVTSILMAIGASRPSVPCLTPPSTAGG